MQDLLNNLSPGDKITVLNLQMLINFQHEAISQSTKSVFSKAQRKGSRVGKRRKPVKKIHEAPTISPSKNYAFTEIKQKPSSVHNDVQIFGERRAHGRHPKL